MYRLAPFGSDHDARQRAELLVGLYSISDKYEAPELSTVLESWGFPDTSGWDYMTEDEQWEMTRQTLRLALP